MMSTVNSLVKDMLAIGKNSPDSPFGLFGASMGLLTTFSWDRYSYRFSSHGNSSSEPSRYGHPQWLHTLRGLEREEEKGKNMKHCRRWGKTIFSLNL